MSSMEQIHFSAQSENCMRLHLSNQFEECIPIIIIAELDFLAFAPVYKSPDEHLSSQA